MAHSRMSVIKICEELHGMGLDLFENGSAETMTDEGDQNHTRTIPTFAGMVRVCRSGLHCCRPLLQTQDEVKVSANAARLWIILPHRQK